MDKASLHEKEVAASAAQRRKSDMSIEEPTTPLSDSGESTSSYHEEDSESTHGRLSLRPTISRASSTNAVGGVFSLEPKLTNATTSDPAFEVDFEDDDAGNPQNWPIWYKSLVLFVMSYATTTVVLFSTEFTSAIPGLQKDFGISNSTGILGLTTVSRMTTLNFGRDGANTRLVSYWHSPWLCHTCSLIGNVRSKTDLRCSFRPLRHPGHSRSSRTEHRDDPGHPVLRSLLCISYDQQCAGIGQRHCKRRVPSACVLDMVHWTAERVRIRMMQSLFDAFSWVSFDYIVC